VGRSCGCGTGGMCNAPLWAGGATCNAAKAGCGRRSASGLWSFLRLWFMSASQYGARRMQYAKVHPCAADYIFDWWAFSFMCYARCGRFALLMWHGCCWIVRPFIMAGDVQSMDGDTADGSARRRKWLRLRFFLRCSCLPRTCLPWRFGPWRFRVCRAELWASTKSGVGESDVLGLDSFRCCVPFFMSSRLIIMTARR